jgi:hypothetical protein
MVILFECFDKIHIEIVSYNPNIIYINIHKLKLCHTMHLNVNTKKHDEISMILMKNNEIWYKNLLVLHFLAFACFNVISSIIDIYRYFHYNSINGFKIQAKKLYSLWTQNTRRELDRFALYLKTVENLHLVVLMKEMVPWKLTKSVNACRWNKPVLKSKLSNVKLKCYNH